MRPSVVSPRKSLLHRASVWSAINTKERSAAGSSATVCGSSQPAATSSAIRRSTSATRTERIRARAATGFSTSVNEPFFCGSSCRNEWRNNTQFDLKTTYFLGTRSMGSHNLVAGVDRWHEMRLADNFQSPSLYVAILAGYAPTVNAD